MRNICLVIPTKGRRTLLNCLESTKDIELLSVCVAYDGHGETPEGYFTEGEVIDLATSYGASFDCVEFRYSDWGYPQIESAYKHMSPEHDYLWNIGDDDVVVPESLEQIFKVLEINTIRPYMVQAQLWPSPNRGNTEPVILWNDEDRSITRSKVTGQNLIVPNIPHLMGNMADDFEFIRSTIEKWQNHVTWLSIVASRCY